MRPPENGQFRIPPRDVILNPFIWGTLGITISLLLVMVYFPPLANVLKVVDPGMDGWGLVLALSLFPYLVGQLLKSLFSSLFVDRPNEPRVRAIGQH